MNTYRTVDLARMFGIHVNTVRLYERYGLIPKAERTQAAATGFLRSFMWSSLSWQGRPCGWRSCKTD